MSKLFLIVLCVIEAYAQQHMTSPCPQFFTYESNGTTTYGIIEVHPIKLESNFKLFVHLSLRSKLQDENYGSLELVGSPSTVFESVRAGQNIKYKVNFPVHQSLPKITQIVYNGDTICTGPAYTNALGLVSLGHTFKTESFRETSTHFTPVIKIDVHSNTVSNPNQPENPCPEYFKYENDGLSTYGIVEVPTIQLGENLQIEVELSIRAQLQNDYFGSFALFESTNAAIESIKLGQKIKYKVTFPVQRPLPKLTKILYNGKEICLGPGEPSGQDYVTSIAYAHVLKTEAYKEAANPGVYIKPLTLKRMSSFIFSNTSSFKDVISPEERNLLIDNEDYSSRKPRMTRNIQLVYPNNPFFKNLKSSERLVTTQSHSTQNTSKKIPPFIYPNNPFFRNLRTSTKSTHSINTEICGKPISTVIPLIFNGTRSKRGEHPWLVALFVKKTRTSNLSFRCGATLITNRVVLTAAHCIHLESNTGQVDKLTEDDIVLGLGKYNIGDRNENGVTLAGISKIYVHEDYKRKNDASYDADIAVIVMKRTIEISAYIRPACVWEENTQVKNLVSRFGIVAGWGIDESGLLSNISNKIELPVVSTQTCINSNDDFRYVMSDRTFCAGKSDGTGPCNGDSGGPFCFKINNQWYLRGIVSSSLTDENSKTCNRKNFLIFTDIVPFLPWIRSFL